MDRRAAKELLHIQAWLERVGAITERGRSAYLADDLPQEAVASLMMNSAKPPTGCPGCMFLPPTESSGRSRSQTATSSFTSTTTSTVL
jgi:hypothetical protein